jgi:hypothetical protein
MKSVKKKSQDLLLFITKGVFLLSSCENLWMQCLTLQLDPKVVFPFRKVMSEEIFLMMVEKCLKEYVTLLFDVTPIAIEKFDLWMSRTTCDTFAFVINFLTPQWEPRHVCVGLFEVNDTTRASLGKQMTILLERFKLTSKIWCFVKNEGTNLGIMIATLRFMVTCEALKVDVLLMGFALGMQHIRLPNVTSNEKVVASLAPMNIKST